MKMQGPDPNAKVVGSIACTMHQARQSDHLDRTPMKQTLQNQQENISYLLQG